MSYPTPSSRRRVRWLTVAAAAPLLFGLLGSTALAATYKVTARSGLNVRSGPGSGYRSLGALENGANVTTIAERGSWRKIRFNGREGWVHSRYLRQTSAAPAADDDQGPADTASTTTNDSGGNFVDALEGRRTLRKGDSGEAVRALQRRLRELGYPVSVDGEFGPQTERALRDFQRANGLSADGVAGPQTIAALDNPNSSGNASNNGNNGGSTSIPTDLPRSSAGFVQLPASGTGFYGYYGANRRWGTPAMVYGLMRVGQAWAGNGARMGVGDISYKNGGPISGHASHQRGVDADLRPVRKDGGESPVTIHQSAYSRTLTSRLLRLIRQHLPVRLIFFNDSAIAGVQHWPNHANHFHVRTTR